MTDVTPPTPGLYAILVTKPEGGTGLCALPTPAGMVPMVGVSAEGMEVYRSNAVLHARANPQDQVCLVFFSEARVLEQLTAESPLPTGIFGGRA